MARPKCPEPCGKVIYTSRKDAHRGLKSLKNQFAYWDPECKRWHTSTTRTSRAVRPVREKRLPRRWAA